MSSRQEVKVEHTLFIEMHLHIYIYIYIYIYTHTTSQEFLNSKIFLKEFSSAHQTCIYLIQNTAKAVIL